jgi:uncharacterized membrane protein
MLNKIRYALIPFLIAAFFAMMMVVEEIRGIRTALILFFLLITLAIILVPTKYFTKKK